MSRPLFNLILTFIILVCLLTCSGCGSSWHLKRAKYHEAKAIALGATVTEKTDTVIQYVDVKVPEIKVDTVFSVSQDTVVFTKDSIQFKILVRNNKVYVHAQSKPRYFRVKQSIYINKTKTISAGYTKWQYFSAIAGSIIFGFVLGFLLSRLLWR